VSSVIIYNYMGASSSSNMSLPVVVNAAPNRHAATLIFLHGLGDTGHGWAASLAEIKPPNLKIVCPTAAAQPVTLNGGMSMPSWFDLKSLDISGPEDRAGIISASENIHKLIDSEVSSGGIGHNRVILGGFSQGGALAIYSALTYKHTLGGIIGLSCWLPLHTDFPNSLQAGNAETPLLQCHGNADPIVRYNIGEKSSEALSKFMSNSSFHSFRGLGHSSSEEEMEKVSEFISKYIPPP